MSGHSENHVLGFVVQYNSFKGEKMGLESLQAILLIGGLICAVLWIFSFLAGSGLMPALPVAILIGLYIISKG